MSNARSGLVTALHDFGLARDRFRSAMATALGVGVTAIDALEHLERFGPLTQRELGDRLVLTSGAVTMLVDRLERDGLVQREAHPTDRRVSLVRLRADVSLPDVPEIERYHQALKAIARRVPATAVDAVGQFLADATDAASSAAVDMQAGRAR